MAKVTIKAARQKYPDKKVIAVFKAHTFSRVEEFADEFANALNLADKAYVMDINYDRENPEDYPGIDAYTIIDKKGATAYGIGQVEDRGIMFVVASQDVYEGQIVGENAKTDDIVVNVCKRKQLTNTRASGSDEALKLTPHIQMSLEQCMEFISDDELLEVTPSSLRMRKKILDNTQRRKARNRANS